MLARRVPITPATPAGDRRRLVGLSIWLVGACLLAGAIIAITSNREAVASAWDALRAGPAWLFAALLLSPLLNIVAVSLSFSVIMRRYGSVGGVEMGALISSAWLLNQLPFRPGLIGRIAYHRLVNGIPLRDCIRGTIEVLACAAVALALILAGVLLATSLGAGASNVVIWSLGLPLLLLAPAWLAARFHTDARRFLACFALRYADILIWAGRYYLVFAAIGRPVSLAQATVITAASQAAMLLPVQLGLREWVVGVTASRLGSHAGIGLDSLAPGLLADVVTRAVEVAVAIPLGLAASLWLQRRLRRCSPKPGTAVGV